MNELETGLLAFVNRFKNALVMLLVVSFGFSVHGQQPPVSIGTERLDSRSAAGLVGAVRSVLTVERRNTGAGYAETLSTAVSTYDRDGAAVERLVHDADIALQSQELIALDHSSIYVYGPGGQVDKLVHYDPDGSVRGRIEYRYDSTGRLVERNIYVGTKELIQKGVISYPAQWQSLEKTESYRDGRVLPGHQWLSIFNNKGQLIEGRMLKPDGSPEQKVVYSYDDQGKLNKAAEYDERNVYRWAHLFSYKFDSRGNWVEKKTVQILPSKDAKLDDRSALMTYRVITYFGQN